MSLGETSEAAVAAEFDEERRKLSAALDSLELSKNCLKNGELDEAKLRAALFAAAARGGGEDPPGDAPLLDTAWSLLERGWMKPMLRATELHVSLRHVVLPAVKPIRGDGPAVASHKHLFSVQEVLALRLGLELIVCWGIFPRLEPETAAEVLQPLDRSLSKRLRVPKAILDVRFLKGGAAPATGAAEPMALRCDRLEASLRAGFSVASHPDLLPLLMPTFYGDLFLALQQLGRLCRASRRPLAPCELMLRRLRCIT